MPAPLPTHVVIVPVKPPAVGKSRLGALPARHRLELATAFALDTARAALDTERVVAVLAVTDDVDLARALVAEGCTAIPDGVSNDLNETLRQGAAEAQRRWPGTTPVALLADLPCLIPDDLADALGELQPQAPLFVRDAAGTGTTMYAAAYDLFAPCFGRDSAQAHLDAGAREVHAEVASLRRDVDDIADLGNALVIGVGRHTAAIAGRRETPRRIADGGPQRL